MSNHLGRSCACPYCTQGYLKCVQRVSEGGGRHPRGTGCSGVNPPLEQNWEILFCKFQGEVTTGGSGTGSSHFTRLPPRLLWGRGVGDNRLSHGRDERSSLVCKPRESNGKCCVKLTGNTQNPGRCAVAHSSFLLSSSSQIQKAELRKR